MSDVKLGQLATETSNRDAIHIAVAPVISDQSLKLDSMSDFFRMAVLRRSEIRISESWTHS